MPQDASKRIWCRAGWLAVALAVLAPGARGVAQEPRIPLTERDEAAVSEAANFFRDPDDLDSILRRVGFVPAGTPEWEAMTPRDRLTHVAARAELGRPSSGSQIFLHRLAVGLGDGYGAGRIRRSDALARYLAVDDPGDQLTFPALPPNYQPRNLLDARQSAAIEEAVRLLDDRPREAVLRHVFAMPPDLARRYLQYETFAETLRYAITGYSDRSMHHRLVLALAQHTVERYGEEAVRRAGGHLWGFYQSCESVLVDASPARSPPTLPPPPCGCQGLRRTLEALGGL